jgi:ABC-type taurine transport system ATPase subunit
VATKLQLKLLSASGELLNVVNASAGRLTVLRSFTPSQLEPYRRAIAGIPGPERIAVTLNGNEFVPEDHILIGFGENTRGIPGTVSEHLVTHGVNSKAVAGLLMSYGLAELAGAPFVKLTACETQRCRLLAATQQFEKSVILNNPFEPLASEWRERFAELILQYVRNTTMPVLVTSMSYRPECFINNELIQRVQVGENDQRTIGFGSGPSEYDELIQKVRSKKLTPEDAESVFPSAPPQKAPRPGQKSKPKKAQNQPAQRPEAK